MTVLDEYSLLRQAREITLSLLTPCRPKPGRKGRIALAAARLPAGRRSAAGVIDMDLPSEYLVQVEIIELRDARLEAVWGSSLTRVVIALSRPPVSGKLLFTIG